jgi:hypothetical protein
VRGALLAAAGVPVFALGNGGGQDALDEEESERSEELHLVDGRVCLKVVFRRKHLGRDKSTGLSGDAERLIVVG